MDIQITARRFTASDQLKSYARSKIEGLQRYYDGITDAHVVLSQPGGSVEYEAEVTLRVFKQVLTASSTASSYELALDSTSDRMTRQIKRFKDRLRDTKRDEHR